MKKINDYEYEVKVAGHLIDVVFVDPGFGACGDIPNGISIRRPDEEGGWDISYKDLVKITLLATWIRLKKFRYWRATINMWKSWQKDE